MREIEIARAVWDMAIALVIVGGIISAGAAFAQTFAWRTKCEHRTKVPKMRPKKPSDNTDRE